MLKVGVFDSGLGGLTVVKAISQTLKNAKIYYIADTLHAPYGDKTPSQILDYSINITNYLLKNYQISVLILACNTATSWAISTLREMYPQLIIIGTEPGIKPAIENTTTGKIGVLATSATLKGEKYQKLVETLSNQSSKDIEIFQQACPKLVEQIEKGHIDTTDTRELLEGWITPMRDKGVDTIVLGCTHYPLIAHIISDIMNQNVTLINTGRAISQRLISLVSTNNHINSGSLEIYIDTTAYIDKTMIDNIIFHYERIKLITISTDNS